MTRYISGISIIRFASFLVWTGLVSCLIFILIALGRQRCYSGDCGHYNETLCGSFELIMNIHYKETFCGSLYGSFELIMNIGMFIYFIYFFKLWKAINSDNMVGMRNLIKIGCYIIGALELVICVLSGVIFPIFMVIVFHTWFLDSMMFVFSITILLAVVSIALIIRMIHGVRKFIPGLVNAYIIFKMVIFAVFAVLMLVFFIAGLVNRRLDGYGWLSGPNMLLIGGFFICYSTGFSVAQYNIILGRETEEGSLDSPPQDNPPA